MPYSRPPSSQIPTMSAVVTTASVARQRVRPKSRAIMGAMVARDGVRGNPVVAYAVWRAVG